MNGLSSIKVLSRCNRCDLHAWCHDGNTDQKLQKELGRHCHVRVFRAGETIVGEAEDCTFIGSVVSGALRLQKTMPDGRQQIVGLLLPTDMFGRVFARTSEFAIEAATDAALCCINRRAFERILAGYPELEHSMLLAILEELDAARDWMLLLGSQTVRERIASFLLLLHRRLHRQGGPLGHRGDVRVVKVPVGRRDVAAYLGTTVESISREIHELDRRGAIRILDPQHFEILDRAKLVCLSGREERLDRSPHGEEDLRRRA